jgi:hypothetical protein
MFVSGNFLEGSPAKNRDNWLMIQLPEELKGDITRLPRMTRPFDFAPVHTDTAPLAYWRILKGAGATLPIRDAVDARIVREIKTGTGHIIDSQNEVGGWPGYAAAPAPPDSDFDGMPDSWETQYGLNPSDPSDNSKDNDSDGYTNIEEFLNSSNPLRSDS